MKTINNLYTKVIAMIAMVITFTLPAKAQLSDNGFANIDWQFNAPLGNHFADKASGWGMNFEGGYFITPNFGLGLFLNYHTNHKYVDRETFQMAGGEVTSDQQHTIFQMPFGVTARYQCNRGGTVQPYSSIKLGTEYAKNRTNFSMYEVNDNVWGCYVSPEIGVNVFPWAYGPGLHFALYYSYSSNKADVLHYHIKNLNNFGFRLGVSF